MFGPRGSLSLSLRLTLSLGFLNFRGIILIYLIKIASERQDVIRKSDIIHSMNITDKEKRTVDYYDQEAESWASAHGGNESESYWKEEMEKFHQLLPSGKVLEIGSGAGKDAAALIALGYDYTGADASEGLINVAQRRNPQARFKKVSVRELDFPAHEFDGFWTTATLLHTPKDKIDEALRKIKLQVKPNGVGFISMKQGGLTFDKWKNIITDLI